MDSLSGTTCTTALATKIVVTAVFDPLYPTINFPADFVVSITRAPEHGEIAFYCHSTSKTKGLSCFADSISATGPGPFVE